MSEKMKAVPVSGGKITEIEVTKTTPFTSGGIEPKNLVEGTVGGHAMSLVERVKFASEYLYNWRAFKAAGLPVVPTVRINEQTGTLLVTDIKADGSEIYGKAMAYNLDEELFRRRIEVDARFLHLMQNELGDIERRVKEYVALADAHSLGLPFDDPFELVVHPSGSWNLLILDLQHANPRGATPLCEPEYASTNKELAAGFLGYLESAKRRFIEAQSK